MEKAFADHSETELVGAIKGNWAALCRLFGSSSRGELDERPDLARFSCLVPAALFNGVFRTRLAPDRVDAAIRKTLTYYAARNVPAFRWWLMPNTQPVDLGEHLESHGFALQQGSTGMAADLTKVNHEPTLPPGLSVHVVSDDEIFGQWSHIGAVCFGMTDIEQDASSLWRSLDFELPLRHYLGLLNGNPVAISTLVLAAGVAGVYMVGVLPDGRRQGIGTAMTLAPLLDARALGYHVGILHASPMGYNVYRRLGFQEYCKMSHYLWQRGSGDAT